MKRALLVSLYELFNIGSQVAFFILWGIFFGAGPGMDSFWASVSLPVVLTAILMEPIIAGLVPILVGQKIALPIADLDRLKTNILCFFFLGGVLFLLVFFFGSGLILRLITPGLDPESQKLGSALLRILSLSMPFRFSLGVLTSCYYAEERYYRPTIAPTVGIAFAIAVLVIFQGSIGIFALPWGMNVLSLVQFLVLAPILKNFSLRLKLNDLNLKKLIKKMLPLLGGNLYYKSDALVDRFIASFLPPGSISYLGYGYRVATAVNQVLCRGFITTRFKELSEHHLASREEFKNSVNRLVIQVVSIGLPAVVLLILFIKPVLFFLFQKSSFTAADLFRISTNVVAFSGLIFCGLLGSVMANSFYAIQDTKSIAAIGIISFTIGIGLKVLGAIYFSYTGVAVASSVYFALALVLEMLVLQNKMQLFEWKAIGKNFMKSLAAAAAMITATILLKRGLADGFISLVLRFALTVAAYILVSFILGESEIRRWMESFRRRAKKRGRNPLLSGLVFMVVIIFSCCSSDRGLFERIEGKNGDLPDSLLTDFSGGRYWNAGNVTFRFGSQGNSLEIQTAFRGNVGVYFLCFSSSKDELEIYKRSKEGKHRWTPLERRSLGRGINEISCKASLKKNEEIYVKVASGRKHIFSKPLAYRILPAEKRRFLFIISVDTLAAGHLGVYGYGKGTTPRLDAFSEDSVVFANAYANSSWTVASHMCLFTSLLENKHGVMFATEPEGKNGPPDEEPKALIFPLRPSIPFLVENMSEEYVALSFNGGINVSHEFGFYRGFDKYYENNNDDLNPESPALLFQEVRDELEAKDFPKVLFFLQTYYVHTPYLPDPFFLSKISTETRRQKFDFRQDLGGQKGVFRSFDEPYVEEVRRLYDAEVLGFDHYFGEFIDFLKEANLYDTSTIILLSDHGEEFLEHGSWVHGTNLYNEQTRVPLIMKFPQQEYRGKKIKANVSLVDILPTLLELNGIVMPAGLDGFSLTGLIGEDRIPVRPVIASLFRSKPIAQVPGRIAVILEGHKLIYNEPSSGKALSFFAEHPPVVPEYELYDLEKDPRELKNIFSKESEAARPLLVHLTKLRREFEEWGGAADSSGGARIYEQLHEKLKSLGYLR